jgi:hypothetical protein
MSEAHQNSWLRSVLILHQMQFKRKYTAWFGSSKTNHQEQQQLKFGCKQQKSGSSNKILVPAEQVPSYHLPLSLLSQHKLKFGLQLSLLLHHVLFVPYPSLFCFLHLL